MSGVEIPKNSANSLSAKVWPVIASPGAATSIIIVRRFGADGSTASGPTRRNLSGELSGKASATIASSWAKDISGAPAMIVLIRSSCSSNPINSARLLPMIGSFSYKTDVPVGADAPSNNAASVRSIVPAISIPSAPNLTDPRPSTSPKRSVDKDGAA